MLRPQLRQRPAVTGHHHLGVRKSGRVAAAHDSANGAFPPDGRFPNPKMRFIETVDGVPLDQQRTDALEQREVTEFQLDAEYETPDPAAILQERFARGEIDDDAGRVAGNDRTVMPVTFSRPAATRSPWRDVTTRRDDGDTPEYRTAPGRVPGRFDGVGAQRVDDARAVPSTGARAWVRGTGCQWCVGVFDVVGAPYPFAVSIGASSGFSAKSSSWRATGSWRRSSG